MQKLLLLGWLAAAPALSQPALSGTKGYVLRGTIRDSTTGRPVAGAYIWPFLQSWGVVSDSAGHYALRWPYPGTETFIIRRCTDRNQALMRVDFRDSSVVERDVVIAADPTFCPAGTRAPWAVDESDTVSFRGHYIYSWEGGGWLASCDGRTFQVDWNSPLGPALRGRTRREGQTTFVRLRGRIAVDGLGDDQFASPLFLVSHVDEVRSPESSDCN